MLDAIYSIPNPGFSFIPVGGSNTLLYLPESPRTTTQFELQTAAPILAGTILDFLIRDS